MPKTAAEPSLSLHDSHGFQTFHEPCRSRLRKTTARNAIAARHQAAWRRRTIRFQVWNVLNHRRFLGGFGMASELFSWAATRGSVRNAQMFQAAVKWLISQCIYMETPVPHPAVTTLLAEAGGEPPLLRQTRLASIFCTHILFCALNCDGVRA